MKKILQQYMNVPKNMPGCPFCPKGNATLQDYSDEIPRLQNTAIFICRNCKTTVDVQEFLAFYEDLSFKDSFDLAVNMLDDLVGEYNVYNSKEEMEKKS